MPHRDIHLDFNFAMQDYVGAGGVSASDLDHLSQTTKQIHQGIHAIKEMGQLPFYHLPHDEESVEHILEKAKKTKDKFDHLIVFGTGGSSLGAKALLQALKKDRSIKITIFDSLDPDSLSSLLESLDLKKTVFNVVSKSGETLETLIQFFIVQKLLKEKFGSKWVDHFIITTDPEQGLLRKICRENDIASFNIPQGIGGRFSVFTSVGLFPAAIAGINIQELLSGAIRAETRTNVDDLWLNPAYMLGTLQYLMNRNKKNNLILMPYSERLFAFAEWYCQLWAESIGKRFSLKGEKIEAGSTPIAACGPRDQHSQLQLYLEGPKDKYILFFRIENFEHSFSISIPDELSFDGKLSYLNQQSIHSILNAQVFATITALAEQNCPSSMVTLPYCDEFGMGQLLFLLQVTTLFASGLYEVNPFDQPAVELAKKLMTEFLHKTTLNQTSPVMWKKLNERFVI